MVAKTDTIFLHYIEILLAHYNYSDHLFLLANDSPSLFKFSQCNYLEVIPLSQYVPV